jgi:hypothetical protein
MGGEIGVDSIAACGSTSWFAVGLDAPPSPPAEVVPTPLLFRPFS